MLVCAHVGSAHAQCGAQAYAGGADPACREPLWTSGFNTSTPLFQFIRTLVRTRKQQQVWASPQVRRVAIAAAAAAAATTVATAVTASAAAAPPTHAHCLCWRTGATLR